MKLYNHYFLLVVLSTVLLQLDACRQTSDVLNKIEPAAVEEIEGSELSRIILTEKAVERIGLTTTPVISKMFSNSPQQLRKVVPYSAVVYDTKGNTWVYTSPEPRVYIRHKISIIAIKRDKVFLFDGPPDGTEVVNVGAVELYGAEFGVGH